MKTILQVFFFIFYVTGLHAQNVNFEWVKTTGNSLLFEYGVSLKNDAVGNTYTTGTFEGTVDFDPGPGTFNLISAGGRDVYLTKSDPLGNLIWAKCFGGTANDWVRTIELDVSNNIYLTGRFGGTTDLDPGTGAYNITANGLYNAYLSKLDNSGNFLWGRLVSKASVSSEGYSIKIDGAGNVYSTGEFNMIADFDPGPGLVELYGYPSNYVIKYDGNGAFLWVKQIQRPPNSSLASVSRGYSLNLNNGGEIYVTGNFYYESDFDPGPGIFILNTPVGVIQSYILKLGADGDFRWVKSFGNSAMLHPGSTVNDNAGNLYITGYFGGTIDFDPGPAVSNLTATSPSDIFVLKLDQAGAFLWAKQLGKTEPRDLDRSNNNSITVDNVGSVYVTGSFTGTGDFDPGSGIFDLTSAGGNDIYLCKLDNNGNFVWAKSMGGSWYEYSSAISIDASKNIYTTGAFHTTVDFDPGPAIYNVTSNGNTDSYLHKMSQCQGNTSSNITAAVCNSYVLNGYTYTSSGNYVQIIANSAGCDSIIILNLTINRKFTSTNATICEGGSYYAGGANQTLPGIYKDTLLTSLGCDSVITTTLFVIPAPKPNLGPDGKLCMDAQSTITPGVFSSYLWQDNSTQHNLIINSPGTYWVKVTNSSNCSATDTLHIISLDTIPKDFLPPSQEVCYGKSLQINVPGYADYLWSTGSTSPNISLNSIGSFYLTVKDFNDCSGTDTITLQRKDCIFIGIPNAFTPNGDGRNDVFTPTIFQDVVSFSFKVYNTYGQKVFETAAYGKGWDGTFKGKLQSPGTYVYDIRFSNIFGYETIERGTVLLIR